MLENGIDQSFGTVRPHSPVGKQASEVYQGRKATPAPTEGSFQENLTNELQLATSDESTVFELNKNKSISAEQMQEIDKVARDLESMLLNMMLKEMWKSVPESELFGNEMATKFYREMWLEKIAESIAVDGTGLGVAEVVKKEIIAREERSISLTELLAYERQLSGIETQEALDTTTSE